MEGKEKENAEEQAHALHQEHRELNPTAAHSAESLKTN
jgi:hypothetical protein